MSAIDDFTGEIRLMGGKTLPHYWLHCNGRALSTSEYPQLFEQIGYRYGGSGASFNIPTIPDLAPNLRYIINTVGIRPSEQSSLGTGLMGEIRYLAGLPDGCFDALPARGQLLSVDQYIALASVLGQRFGGADPFFALPNLPSLTPTSGPPITPLICIAGIFPIPDRYYSDAYVSEVRQMALSFTARGWQPCRGQQIPIPGNVALFALIEDRYGPSDLRDFTLPTIPNSGGVGYSINAQGVFPDGD